MFDIDAVIPTATVYFESNEAENTLTCLLKSENVEVLNLGIPQLKDGENNPSIARWRNRERRFTIAIVQSIVNCNIGCPKSINYYTSEHYDCADRSLSKKIDYNQPENVSKFITKFMS